MLSPALKHPQSSPLSPTSSVLSASERRAWIWWLWDGRDTYGHRCGSGSAVGCVIKSEETSVGTVTERVR